ncbi:MAG: RDD family protein [Parvibaculum sp.]
MSEQNSLSDQILGEAGGKTLHVWPAGAFDGIIWARTLAFLADIAVIVIASLAATVVFGVLGILTFGLLWPGISLTPLIALAYFTLTLGGPQSATPGMRWQGIELRTWDGQRPGYVQAALQTILFYVTVPLGSLLLLIVPFLNYRRRCLHDYLCGTVFVHRSA